MPVSACFGQARKYLNTQHHSFCYFEFQGSDFRVNIFERNQTEHMSGAVAFIEECLTSSRERSIAVKQRKADVDIPHVLQERQWIPIARNNHEQEEPLSLCWDHTGRYCAEGSNRGNVTIWNFAENTAPYNAFDRGGVCSFLAADLQHQRPPATSATMAWSNTCHSLYMASNFSSPAVTETGTGLEALVCCWDMSDKAGKAVHSIRYTSSGSEACLSDALALPDLCCM